MKRMLPSVGLLGLLLAGCSPEIVQRPSDPAPPTALTPDQRAAALERGRAISGETFSLLSSNLQTAMASGGVSNALPYCSLAASPLTASVAERHGVSLQRITHKPRNPAARAEGVELAVLDRFRAQLETNAPPQPLVTNLVAGQATYFGPIVLNNELCLNCHGIPGQQITSNSLALLQTLYPQDEATGFRIGDLRGAWRMDIPLANLARSGPATGEE